MQYGGTLSAADYLKAEEAAPEKNEYVAGRMFAMVGANANHERIVVNLAVNFERFARKCGCDLFASNMKLKIESLGIFYYPDLIVSCEPIKGNAVFVQAPCLVAEVLSDSTQSVDRREKLMAYKSVASIREYLIVSQTTKQAELYRKTLEHDWELFEFRDADNMTFRCLPGGDVHLPLSELYHRVEFD